MTGLAAAKSLLAQERKLLWGWVVLGCVLVFVAAIRLRLLDVPLERDEGEYAYIGQLLLDGVMPGKLAYTMKLPGTPAAYAVLTALFGQSCAGVHLGFWVVNSAAIVLVFLIARALAGGLAGPVAAASYALMSLSADTLGTSAHATHFVVLLALTGLVLLWLGAKTGRLAAYFGSGLMLSGSVLMKHNGALFVAFGTAWLAWLGVSGRLGPRRALLKSAGAYVLGLAVPALLLLLVLWRAQTLEKSWFWAVTYARAYAQPNPGPAATWRLLMDRLPGVMYLPFSVGVLGLAALWLKRSSWPAAVLASGFLACSLAAVIPGLHLRPHYYVLLMPAVAMLMGILVQEATERLRRCRWKALAWGPGLLFALFLVLGVARERDFFFRFTPVEACRSLYGFQPFPEALAVGEYLGAHSAPGARIAVVGSEPEIYFYAHRRSATGYIYMFPLTEEQPFAEQMRREMKQEIEAARPDFIVQVRTWTSWLGGPKGTDWSLCDALTPPGYKLIGTCDSVPTEARSGWQWKPVAPKEPPGTASKLWLLERIHPAGLRKQGDGSHVNSFP